MTTTNMIPTSACVTVCHHCAVNSLVRELVNIRCVYLFGESQHGTPPEERCVKFMCYDVIVMYFALCRQ